MKRSYEASHCKRLRGPDYKNQKFDSVYAKTSGFIKILINKQSILKTLFTSKGRQLNSISIANLISITKVKLVIGKMKNEKEKKLKNVYKV